MFLEKELGVQLTAHGSVAQPILLGLYEQGTSLWARPVMIPCHHLDWIAGARRSGHHVPSALERTRRGPAASLAIRESIPPAWLLCRSS